MKNTFENAKENVSDEQLKHVTGGARINSRPEAPEDHLIDHGDLHGTAAADGFRLPPPPPTVSGPAMLVEKIQFSRPVNVQGMEDDDGNAIPGIDQIEVYSNGNVYAIHDYPGQPGHLEWIALGGDFDSDYSQVIVNDAVAQGDQVSITGGPVLWLPNKG